MKTRSRRYGNAGEPWEIASERLRALPAIPTEVQVAHALAPLGISTYLLGHEASRVLALMNVSGGRTAYLKAAAIPGSVPPSYSAVRLVAAVHARRAGSRATSQSSAARRRALAALPEAQRSYLASAVASEKAAMEQAQAYEKLAKLGTSPAWVARSHRATANEAKRRRIALEDQLLAGKGFGSRHRSRRRV